MSAEVLQLLFALAGAGLGWYVRHRTFALPPEVATAIQALLARRQQQQTHDLLQELLDAVRPPATPPSAPAPPKS